MSKSNVSIIIVGAGAAGFAAVVKLTENGFTNVTVLEAEDRIGGRIYTTEFSNGLIDLGAQWCHGIDGNIVHTLAGSESFIETKMDFSKMSFSRSDGSDVNNRTCETLMQLCEKIMDEIKTEKVGTIDDILTRKFFKNISQEPYKDINKDLAIEVLKNFKRRESSYCGCEDLEKISVDGYNKFKDCKGPTWLNWKGKGFKTIFEHLLQSSKISRSDIESKILLNKEVVNIDYHDALKIKVKCIGGEIFIADHVVVTVSLSVLKSSAIFTPELPIAKKQAIEEISFGAVGKIFISFNEKFWSDDWLGLTLLWREEDLKEIEGTKNSW